MKMKPRLARLLLVAVGLMFGNAAIADEGVGFALRAEPGITSYGNSTSSISTVGYIGESASGMYYYDITLGATAFLPSGLTIDGYYRLPLTKAKNQMKYGAPVDVAVKLERKEYNLTLAYPIADTASIFAGWRNFSIKTSNVVTMGLIPLANQFKFDSSGPTIGLSYGVLSNDRRSNHNFVVGLSYQTGKFDAILGSGSVNVQAKKSGIAYSVGYKYGRVISDKWDVGLGIDYYFLNLKNLRYQTSTFSYREASLSGRLSIRYTF